MKYPGHFLIVWDFIREAKARGIPVGPGRGSGAGSLVAFFDGDYCTDPLPSNCLFERFLNPERVSMPDFDINFCMARRDEVHSVSCVEVRRRECWPNRDFPEPEGAKRDQGRGAHDGMQPTEAQRIASLIPEKGPGQICTIAEALKTEPKLKAILSQPARDRAHRTGG